MSRGTIIFLFVCTWIGIGLLLYGIVRDENANKKKFTQLEQSQCAERSHAAYKFSQCMKGKSQ